jgi:hypothetical protein
VNLSNSSKSFTPPVTLPLSNKERLPKIYLILYLMFNKQVSDTKQENGSLHFKVCHILNFIIRYLFQFFPMRSDINNKQNDKNYLKY